jgi:hypothetical protein
MFSAMKARSADSSQLQTQLLEKVDSSGDGAIDKSELTSFMDYVSSKTSTEAGDVDAMFEAMDTDGNGSISSDELSENGDVLLDSLRGQLSAMAPPSPPDPEGDAAGRMMLSLIQQYTTVSASATGESSQSSLVTLA